MMSPDTLRKPANGARPAHVPAFVSIFNPIASRLLRIGTPLGPNALLTVRGRKSGQLRTTPVALVEVHGRRWVQSPCREVNWLRNLPTAGAATITVNHRPSRAYVKAIDGDRQNVGNPSIPDVGGIVLRLRQRPGLVDHSRAAR